MRDIISGKTTICGLIGDPVEHTMSPIMHNAAFKTLGLDYVYLPFKVKSLELRKAVEGMRALNIQLQALPDLAHQICASRVCDSQIHLADLDIRILHDARQLYLIRSDAAPCRLKELVRSIKQILPRWDSHRSAPVSRSSGR